uniref:Uncharacterized protein n=1 Tax=Coccidioides posadasii RMSCC 3488 TaxID=454284 RepID=A0A0J6HY95_COCPO|nr:hypothetical protein CPAG_00299 [Coccidioides posadasii RMSCC 3488]
MSSSDHAQSHFPRDIYAWILDARDTLSKNKYLQCDLPPVMPSKNCSSYWSSPRHGFTHCERGTDDSIRSDLVRFPAWNRKGGAPYGEREKRTSMYRKPGAFSSLGRTLTAPATSFNQNHLIGNPGENSLAGVRVIPVISPQPTAVTPKALSRMTRISLSSTTPGLKPGKTPTIGFLMPHKHHTISCLVWYGRGAVFGHQHGGVHGQAHISEGNGLVVGSKPGVIRFPSMKRRISIASDRRSRWSADSANGHVIQGEASDEASSWRHFRPFASQECKALIYECHEPGGILLLRVADGAGQARRGGII